MKIITSVVKSIDNPQSFSNGGSDMWWIILVILVIFACVAFLIKYKR